MFTTLKPATFTISISVDLLAQSLLLARWSSHPSLPRTFLVLKPEIPHPRKPLFPGKPGWMVTSLTGFHQDADWGQSTLSNGEGSTGAESASRLTQWLLTGFSSFRAVSLGASVPSGGWPEPALSPLPSVTPSVRAIVWEENACKMKALSLLA